MSLLQVTDLTMRFRGLLALNSVVMTIESGTIHGLIGPNGAGKTTLFNCVSGLYKPTSGTVTLNGQALHGIRAHDIVALGIARTFQNLNLFREMTVLQNVAVGCHCRTQAGFLAAVWPSKAVRAEEESVQLKAAELLDFVGLGAKAQEKARNLAYGEQRLLEIARALAAEPRLLMLDEPAAGMNPSEKTALMALIRQIRDKGTAVLLVEHDMRVAMGLCDRLTVLNYGIKIAEGSPREIQSDPLVIEAYLGGAAKRA